MNIQTVAANLRNTIAGKERMLASLNPNNPYSEEFKSEGEVMARRATIEFLKINIAELNRILDDLVECQVTGINLTWQQNPDRSGGQFTQDEIDNAGRWK